MKEIDSIMVGPLTSGKEDARSMRKELNRRVEALHGVIQQMHSNMGKRLFQVATNFAQAGGQDA